MFNLFDILNFSCFYIYNYIITPPYYIAKYFYNKYVDDYEINYIEEYTENILNQLNFDYEKVEDSYDTINYGFILSNHRSFFDFVWDSYIFKSAFIGRVFAYIAVSLSNILCYMASKMIIMMRGIDTREKIFERTLNHLFVLKLEKEKSPNNPNIPTNILYYPEATRKSHLHVDINNHYLKPGLLKSIWEDCGPLGIAPYLNRQGVLLPNDSLKVQICITSNKENLINEKIFFVNNKWNLFTRLCKNKKPKQLVKYYIDEPINPKDFKTFDEFYTYIINRWCIAWSKVYSSHHTLPQSQHSWR